MLCLLRLQRRALKFTISKNELLFLVNHNFLKACYLTHPIHICLHNKIAIQGTRSPSPWSGKYTTRKCILWIWKTNLDMHIKVCINCHCCGCVYWIRNVHCFWRGSYKNQQITTCDCDLRTFYDIIIVYKCYNCNLTYFELWHCCNSSAIGHHFHVYCFFSGSQINSCVVLSLRP